MFGIGSTELLIVLAIVGLPLLIYVIVKRFSRKPDMTNSGLPRRPIGILLIGILFGYIFLFRPTLSTTTWYIKGFSDMYLHIKILGIVALIIYWGKVIAGHYMLNRNHFAIKLTVTLLTSEVLLYLVLSIFFSDWEYTGYKTGDIWWGLGTHHKELLYGTIALNGIICAYLLLSKKVKLYFSSTEIREVEKLESSENT